MTKAKQLGDEGEKLARKYLARHKHKILAKNFSAQGIGEIDIITYDKVEKELVFVEVKTRSESSVKYFEPSKAVNAKKRHSIIKTAEIFMRKYYFNNVPFRFDIIEVVEKDINHIKNAF